MNVKINEVDAKVILDSLSIEDAIGERSTASFIVYDEQGQYHFSQNQKVEIYDGIDLVFAGFIDLPNEQEIPGTTSLTHTIRCKDNHYLADKRIIAKAYESITTGAVVNDIITNYLATEGVTVGNVMDGADLTEAVFNYVPVSKALEALAERSGYIWYIDYDKKLYFIPRATYSAPWDLTNADILSGSLTVENSNSKYRNKQYVKGGRDITDPMTENKKGDGATRTWVLGFPLAKVPTLTLNSTPILASDVGIRGVDESKKYYWSKGSDTITHDNSQTLLTASDTLGVTFQGEYDVVVVTFDPEQIENLKTIEGSSGVVEDVSDDMDTSNREASFQNANSKLQKYGVIGRRIMFTTRRSGLFAGQVIDTTLLQHEINNVECLIECVTIDFIDDQIRYKVKCAEGPEQNSWTKMFEVMATRGQAFVVRQNISEKQILVTLDTFSKTWESADNPNIFKEVYASDTLFPSTALYPMFAFTDRVKYIELLDSLDGVLLRKRVTKQTGSDTGEILSTIYIAPFEANDQIDKIRFYGGTKATSVNDSGVPIDEQPYSKLKTQLEAIQLEKTDTRNFVPMTGTKVLDVPYWQSVDDAITLYTLHAT